jgi:pilus assembly protein Flp/PilA
MNRFVFAVVTKVRSAFEREDGQDLVEYAMVVALIAFASVSAMGTLAGSINNSFTMINAVLTSNVT